MDQDQSPPEIEGLPILDESAQQTVDKLDHIIEVSHKRLQESVQQRRGLAYIRNTLDKIVDRMESAPYPVLGDPPKAPTGTRMKRAKP